SVAAGRSGVRRTSARAHSRPSAAAAVQAARAGADKGASVDLTHRTISNGGFCHSERVQPLDVLFEEPGAAAELPAALAALYGGGLALAGDLVYGNFITSLDGVAALAAPRGSGPALRGDGEADRFVMGLLRS